MAKPRFASCLLPAGLMHRVVMALCCAGLGGSSALAQQRYELQDERGWQAQAVADPDSAEGRLAAGRKALAEGRPSTARKIADRWIKDYPNHPRAVEAFLLRGDARSADGDHYAALFDYEYVIRVYPASEQYLTAVEREFQIARLFVNGVRRRFAGMAILNAEPEAEEIFIRVQERAPGSDLGERAMLELADYYFRNGRMSAAAEAYDLLLLNYPRSASREMAMQRRLQANLARFRGPRFDPSGLIEARQNLQSYQKEFPASAERMGGRALDDRIDESLALKTLETANWYARTGKDISAVYLYRRLIREHPTSGAARIAAGKLADRGLAPQAVAPDNQPGPTDPDDDAPRTGPSDPDAPATRADDTP